MIEGLKFRMTSKELYEHLNGLVVKHGGKSETYKGGIAHLEQAEEFANHQMSGDPIYAMAQKASEHQNKRAMFAFLRDHIIPDEVYELNQNDLYTLEIMSRY